MTPGSADAAARACITVRGRVQGVGFRYFVLRTARAAGLTGFVRNLRDGSVEVVSEGPREKLEGLLREIGEGPRHGIVTAVEVEWAAPSGEFLDFDVRF